MSVLDYSSFTGSTVSSSGSFPYAQLTKLTMSPTAGKCRNGARVSKAQFRTTGKDGRTVTVNIDLKKQLRLEVNVLYDDLMYKAERLEEICIELPISLCMTNMAAHFEIIATHPTLLTLSIDTPVLCGMALRELLTCLTLAQNGIVTLTATCT